MATLDWPASLNSIQPSTISFHNLVENQTETQEDSNSKISYLLASNLNIPNKMTVTFEFTPENFKVFNEFYKNDTKSGVLFYNWHHPLIGGKIEVRIVGGVRLRQRGLNLEVSISLEYNDI